MRTRARWVLACLSLIVALPSFGQQKAASHWPTLTEQTEAAGARPGTAFAALIAANQDFSILDPSEFRDDRRLPLWLRVHWRRHHPEMVYSPDDPTRGYPLVLKEVLEWMQTHQDLKPGPGDRADEAELCEEGGEKSATISAEQRISGLQTTPRSESDIRVNYWDSTKIIGASNNITGGGTQSQFYSTNGGTSWGQSSLTLQTGDAFHSDPTVDWTSDGTAWSTTIGINAGQTVFRMRAYKSIDNGATWSFDATFSGTQNATDKQLMWTDHSNSSPFKDNIYVCWHNGAPAFTNRRTGPGGSWQTPLQISGAESTGTAIGCDVKTNAMGDVFNFWPATGNRRILVAKSTNGGVSYGTPVQIATTVDSFEIAVPAFANRKALIYVSGGAYRTASKDLVYAVWNDLSNETGCTSGAQEPGTNVSSTCKSRIWFARSTNGGASWSAPVKINNQAGLNDQFNPALAVDETTGAVSVIYYDTVGNAGRKKTDIWYQSSFDDGVSWSPAVKITSAQTDETTGGQDSGNQYGDYNSLSGFAGIFFPSWTDRRNNAREEVWTAKITDIACTAPGTPAIGTATANGFNEVDVTWGNGAPAATTFNVYRALGSCASPGSFSLVGPGVAGSPFVDYNVSPSTTYAYKVSGRDATAVCQSAQSACAEATTPAFVSDLFSNGFEEGLVPGPWSGVN